ncbi:hypothetical protein CcCBS67573_g00714 [Chytriomyces confervae]|uniref:Uncharacterized protein n=1 Tax=Chytriomyces confervae TaxID=246404 RepID=A0A507FRQ2_9FUNG|nr:hypothetical protein HDU80_004708 [Chytriomyces hyalinus]TPX78068.1 hypothetical protein CcCBS67573_g00714 [Chytriomyces confervae]
MLTIQELLQSKNFKGSLIPALCFIDDLILNDAITQQPIGHQKTDISAAKFKSTPCYFISVFREYSISATGNNSNANSGRVTWTLSAYVNAHLETLTETVQCVTYSGSSAAGHERIVEAVRDDEADDSMTVTESVTGFEDPSETRISLSRDHSQPVFNGSELVLMRLLASMEGESTIVAQRYFQQALFKITYQVDMLEADKRTAPESAGSQEGNMLLEPLTRIKMTVSTGRGGTPASASADRRSSTIDPENQRNESKQEDGFMTKEFDLSFNAIVHKAISLDDGMDKASQGWEAEAKHVKDGACVYLQGTGGFYNRDWYAEKVGGILKADTTVTSASSKTVGHDQFDGNVELISEFKQRKAEMKKAHNEYIAQHPELKEILADYIQLMLQKKPANVFEFTQTWLTKP